LILKTKNAELTILIQKDTESGWYVGQIEEFPGAISQGKTIDELKENLKDALKYLSGSSDDSVDDSSINTFQINNETCFSF